MSNPNIAKVVQAKFTGGTTNDPVSVTNLTTGEIVDTFKGETMRLESKQKSFIFDAQNFKEGWTVGDVIQFNIGGLKAGSASITLTADTNAPQTVTAVAATSSTAVITI